MYNLKFNYEDISNQLGRRCNLKWRPYPPHPRPHFSRMTPIITSQVHGDNHGEKIYSVVITDNKYNLQLRQVSKRLLSNQICRPCITYSKLIDLVRVQSILGNDIILFTNHILTIPKRTVEDQIHFSASIYIRNN